jgi:hypothetical protein
MMGAGAAHGAASFARRLRPIAVAVAAAALLATGLFASAAAASQVAWGTPEAVAEYGYGIRFRQPATLPADAARLEILIDEPGAAAPFVEEVAIDRTGPQAYTLDAATSLLLPNTRVGARWRVTSTDGTVDVGPRVTALYQDTRFDWRTKVGSIVRVHSYASDQSLVDDALKVGDEAVAKASKLLGVTETEPVDFFVYANEADFADLGGVTGREWVGGFALPETRTLFMWDEGDPAYFRTTVAHELTHVVFDTATKNPYHQPLHWLNEGTAAYLSEGYSPRYRREVEAALRDATIMPLEAIAGAFPTTSDRALLAYGESTSAVKYIVDTYGQEALAKLIRAYAAGVSDDEAFRTGLGVSLAEFEASWLDSLGATTPERYGPQSAPPGPVPSAWAQSGQATPTPATGRSAGPTATGATPAPSTAQTGAATPIPNGTGGGTSSRSPLEIAIVVAAFVLAIGAGAWLALRGHGRRPPPPPPSSWQPPVPPGPA